jgi:hypothetical protein
LSIACLDGGQQDKQIGRCGYQNLPTIVDGVAIRARLSE